MLSGLKQEQWLRETETVTLREKQMVGILTMSGCDVMKETGVGVGWQGSKVKNSVVGEGTVDDFLDERETATDDCQVIKAKREEKQQNR